MVEDLAKLIRIETLLNAQLHDGNPQPGPIMGKIMGTHPDLRPRAQEINQLIKEEVVKVKGMSPEAIAEELDNLAPKAVEKHLEKKAKQAEQHEEKRESLPDLPNAQSGKVVVRYAPEPSKYPHLGQGINYLINRVYADKYDGKVVLRFDDTNPVKVKPEFYDAIKDGMKWIGATWDEEVRASAYLEEIYDTARDLLQRGEAYVCFCSVTQMRTLREEGTTCEHRDHSTEQNVDHFDDMLDSKYDVGKAIVRLMGDMKTDNMNMRDPILLRIIDDQHPMLDQFYPVFPMYDFESAYFEAKLGITHVIRSGEFGSMRKELQSHIIELLGGTVPEFIQFGRINIQGCPTQGRIIRKLVEEEIVSGWDDIRLVTLVGLKHRGLHPHTAREIVEKAGLSAQQTNLAWSTVESISRQLLEPESKRFFYVEDPVKIIVEDAPHKTVHYPYHPDHPEYGEREFETTDTFFISQGDAVNYTKDTIFRLKDLYNVKITEFADDIIHGVYYGEELLPRTDKIQWVGEDYIEGTLDVPLLLQKGKSKFETKEELEEARQSMSSTQGFFEPSIANIEDGEVVQLERIGFAKIFVDDTVSGHITHRF